MSCSANYSFVFWSGSVNYYFEWNDVYSAQNSRRYQFVAHTIPSCEGTVHLLIW
jgi:hypothetical protein